MGYFAFSYTVHFRVKAQLSQLKKVLSKSQNNFGTIHANTVKRYINTCTFLSLQANV